MRFAFVVCPGPQLPADHMHLLADRFTIAVNRGVYAPAVKFTAVVWRDIEISTELRGGIDSLPSVKLTSPVGGWCAEQYCLPPGNEWPDKQAGIATMYHCANTGSAAARWALALGCQHVYMLGFSDGAEARPSDFRYWYGARFPARPIFREKNREDARRLLEHHADQVTIVNDGVHLATIVGAMDEAPRPTKRIIKWVHRRMRDAGAKHWAPAKDNAE